MGSKLQGQQRYVGATGIWGEAGQSYLKKTSEVVKKKKRGARVKSHGKSAKRTNYRQITTRKKGCSRTRKITWKRWGRKRRVHKRKLEREEGDPHAGARPWE